MLFAERIKQLRVMNGMTQEDLANRLGVVKRTLQNYESGTMYPRNPAIYKKLGEVFDIDPASLISEEDQHVIFAIEKGGAKSRRDVQALVTEVGGLFAGGELSEDDKDKVLKTITDLYWIAKENNNKYTPKKYLSEKPV